MFAEEKLLHLAMVFCNCLDVSANVGEVAVLQVMVASFLRDVCSTFDVEAHNWESGKENTFQLRETGGDD